jgi:hypothetical protein
MTNKEYFAIAVDVFPVPNIPGPSAAVATGMTAAVIAETTRLHREATQVYHTYHNVDQAFKKLIIESFDDMILNALLDEIVGYANCTSLQLLTHILTYYAMITPTELTQNYERLNTLYDPKLPIKTLLQQIQDTRAFAIAGGQPYGAAMIVNVAYTLVFKTVLHVQYRSSMYCMRNIKNSNQSRGREIPNLVLYSYCELRIWLFFSSRLFRPISSIK